MSSRWGVPFIMAEDPPQILAAARILAASPARAPLPRWSVDREHRLEPGRWLPLPDVVVLRGPDATDGTRLARADDVAPPVEASDTS